MSSLPNSLLLTQLQSGDAIALEALFERYEAPLFQFLLGMLRDHHQAEDALQETFIKALTNHLEIDPNRFRGWLFTVAYREAMLVKRQQKRHLTFFSDSLSEIADPLPSGASVVEQNDQSRRLRELLDQLPRPQREVILARIYEGKRYRDIANELGCPLNTALARMHDGLKKLRSLWEESHA